MPAKKKFAYEYPRPALTVDLALVTREAKPRVLQQVSEAAARDLLRPAVALLSAAGQQVETAVASGDPAHMLAEILESHGCDAVIMSARGGGLRAAVLGSVSQEMVQRSAVPVTLVKVPDEEPAGD